MAKTIQPSLKHSLNTAYKVIKKKMSNWYRKTTKTLQENKRVTFIQCVIMCECKTVNTTDENSKIENQKSGRAYM